MSNTIKHITVAAGVFCLFFTAHTQVSALAPGVEGRVVVEDTGAPIPGVWVRWEDSWGNSRYVQTDSEGKFFYISWQDRSVKRNVEFNTMVDTDLDGVEDSKLSSTNDRGYGCHQNPHSFTAVVPTGWQGSFTTVSGQLFSNVGFTYNVGDIYYQSAAVASECICETTEMTGSIAAGSTVDFTTVAFASDPDLARVDNISYNVNKDGVEIFQSGLTPVAERDDGKFQSTWSYTFPEENAQGSYNIKVNIGCLGKTAELMSPPVGLLGSLARSISAVFSPRGKLNPASVSNYQLAQSEESLKLGTFEPEQRNPDVNITCKKISFELE
ncbi:MAG: hypothetical protein UV73_C0008G0051 [Candidatus Gottesmanbacteria bacterium GW2011_GWA2_43_14]|uniref:Carboxypeptidase regulatory-like domain-containing protein n=1 Tax=Candidatus Gottesmanbacteria bacterium GW2011_GWA2_43_14 TaxID=1618443 RepID=A0A0G1FR68_9BACT|nr:MAG: hypothetical protein UV73_C0008G0051 [Candidatus Gottesmanbacteria bacterium GW2011_GWA2_43_14]